MGDGTLEEELLSVATDVYLIPDACYHGADDGLALIPEDELLALEYALVFGADSLAELDVTEDVHNL